MVALPLIVGYDSYIRERDFMALPTDKKDQILYRSVIVDDNSAKKLIVKRELHFDQDTTPSTTESFAQLANQRKELLRVKAHTDYSGLYGDVEAAENCVAVISVPYDERMILKIDGVATEPIVGNIGFFAVNCPKGKHRISISVH
jgi:uncharacterized membrane protein YfhO